MHGVPLWSHRPFWPSARGSMRSLCRCIAAAVSVPQETWNTTQASIKHVASLSLHCHCFGTPGHPTYYWSKNWTKFQMIMAFLKHCLKAFLSQFRTSLQSGYGVERGLQALPHLDKKVLGPRLRASKPYGLCKYTLQPWMVDNQLLRRK